MMRGFTAALSIGTPTEGQCGIAHLPAIACRCTLAAAAACLGALQRVEEFEQRLRVGGAQLRVAVASGLALAVVAADGCVHRRCASVVEIRRHRGQHHRRLWCGKGFVRLAVPAHLDNVDKLDTLNSLAGSVDFVDIVVMRWALWM